MASPRGQRASRCESALARAARGLVWRWLRRGHQVGGAGRPDADRGNVPLAWADGLVLPAERAIVELNNIVHGLAWQAEVCSRVGWLDAAASCAREALRPGEHRRGGGFSADLLSPA